jgi:hypothetical protein
VLIIVELYTKAVLNMDDTPGAELTRLTALEYGSIIEDIV